MSRRVSHIRCGTKEIWNKNLNKYGDTYHVLPAEVYVSENSLCLVTSPEWCAWLSGTTDKVPEVRSAEDRIIFENGNIVTIIPSDNQPVRGKAADKIMFL